VKTNKPAKTTKPAKPTTVKAKPTKATTAKTKPAKPTTVKTKPTKPTTVKTKPTKATPSAKPTKSGVAGCKRTSGGTSCSVKIAPGATFELNGEKGVVGKQLGEPGAKGTVFALTSFGSQSNLVIKVLKDAPSKTELAATKAAGQLIASGEVNGEHIMIQTHAPGSELITLLEALPEAQRATVAKNIKPAIAQKAVALAESTKFWHNDLHGGNIFVSGSLGDGTTVTQSQITLIDWGQAVPLSTKNKFQKARIPDPLEATNEKLLLQIDPLKS